MMVRCAYACSLIYRLLTNGFTAANNDAEFYAVNYLINNMLLEARGKGIGAEEALIDLRSNRNPSETDIFVAEEKWTPQQKKSIADIVKLILDNEHRVLPVDLWMQSKLGIASGSVYHDSQYRLRGQKPEYWETSSDWCMPEVVFEFEQRFYDVLMLLLQYSVEFCDTSIRFRCSMKSRIAFPSAVVSSLKQITELGLNDKTLEALIELLLCLLSLDPIYNTDLKMVEGVAVDTYGWFPNGFGSEVKWCLDHLNCAKELRLRIFQSRFSEQLRFTWGSEYDLRDKELARASVMAMNNCTSLSPYEESLLLDEIDYQKNRESEVANDILQVEVLQLYEQLGGPIDKTGVKSATEIVEELMREDDEDECAEANAAEPTKVFNKRGDGWIEDEKL